MTWLLQDVTGVPRITWRDRFGLSSFDESLVASNEQESPQIDAERDGIARMIKLPSPFYAATDRLKAGAKWTEKNQQYEVVGRDEVAGRTSWKLAVSSGLGLRQLVWVDAQARLVVKHQEAVFLGQGVPHELTLELAKTEMVPGDEVAQIIKSHEVLAALRGPVRNRSEAGSRQEPPATPKLLDQAKVTLLIIQSEQSKAYADLAKEAVREIQAAIESQEAVAKLAAQAVGKPAKDFSLTTTAGSKVSLGAFKGKPVVLHFWDYRSEPKVAPYGETGYLDFVSRQRAKQGVQVVGIAVDERLRDPTTRSAARKDVRSFCEFMNLSYPVAFDDEKLIASFGDPRQVGGKLPLYVVIAPNGEVVRYHPGLWASTPDEGLKELDHMLQKLIQ
ncbi:MAG: TlpA family protein disulfide reductase [Planctomycetes bacterium]|nr:TlpA family protein disulfide reductase [Planctomycetota bacterium]